MVKVVETFELLNGADGKESRHSVTSSVPSMAEPWPGMAHQQANVPNASGSTPPPS
jgi:hypothetical protein